MNPFTKLPHSGQYKKILEARKKLPVFAQMTEFLKIVSGGALRLTVDSMMKQNPS